MFLECRDNRDQAVADFSNQQSSIGFNLDITTAAGLLLATGSRRVKQNCVTVRV